jgi:hypothetical protein
MPINLSSEVWYVFFVYGGIFNANGLLISLSGITVTGLGDAAASIVGTHFGRNRVSSFFPMKVLSRLGGKLVGRNLGGTSGGRKNRNQNEKVNSSGNRNRSNSRSLTSLDSEQIEALHRRARGQLAEIQKSEIQKSESQKSEIQKSEIQKSPSTKRKSMKNSISDEQLLGFTNTETQLAEKLSGGGKLASESDVTDTKRLSDSPTKSHHRKLLLNYNNNVKSLSTSPTPPSPEKKSPEKKSSKIPSTLGYKTIEGTLAFFICTLIFQLWMLYLVGFHEISYPSLIRLMFADLMVAVLEAVTDQVDNLLLPLYHCALLQMV